MVIRPDQLASGLLESAPALGVVGVVNKTGDVRTLIEAVDRALGAAPAEPIDIDDELDRARFRLLNAKLREKIGQLEEKDGVARDLHDIVIQRLFAVGMQLQSLRPHVERDHQERLDSITAEMDETIGDIRNTIHALKSNDITHDLRVMVQRLVDQTPAILGFRAALHISGPINTLVPDAAQRHRRDPARVAVERRAPRPGQPGDGRGHGDQQRVRHAGHRQRPRAAARAARERPGQPCGPGPRAWAG